MKTLRTPTVTGCPGTHQSVPRLAVAFLFLFNVGLAPRLRGQTTPPSGPATAPAAGAKEVVVDGFRLSYTVEGEGIPCIVINDAPAMRRALPRSLRSRFKFTFMDPRMNVPYESDCDIKRISLDTLLDDIEHVRQEAGVDKVLVFGHSINGLTAYEYARKYPDHVIGVVMNGTPPSWQLPRSVVDSRWAQASPERKEVLRRSREKTRDAIARLSPGEAMLQSYIANAALYWHDPTYNCAWLFEGVRWNQEVWNHLLNSIVVGYDISKRPPLKVPLLLTLGRDDFVVPCTTWDGIEKALPNLTVRIFEKSGHWAFLEEPGLFDRTLSDWADAAVLKKQAALRQKLTILCDNAVARDGVKAVWGFACLVEAYGHTVLFDTGADPAVLKDNLAALKIDPSRIEAVVISHYHGDHTLGASGLGTLPGVRVLTPRSLEGHPGESTALQSAGLTLVPVSEATPLFDGIAVSEPMHFGGRIPFGAPGQEFTDEFWEQCLTVDTPAGLVVVVGCSHPGIFPMLERVKRQTGRPLYLVIGGFHLLGQSDIEVRHIAASMQALGVAHVSATHCTGEAAASVFRDVFGDRYVTAGAGAVIDLPFTGTAEAPAQTEDDRALTAFDRREVMIPIRDGVRLFTLILTPKGATEPLPLLLSRTPYGTNGWGGTKGFANGYKELREDGYIFVFQDIRGRYKSEGQFVMIRPPRDRRDPQSTDEATDTWDTIEWLVGNIPGNNGRVGMLGISYPGWLTDVAMLEPHPALKATSPQAPPGDMWMGDDFFHQGAFRLSYGLEYAWWVEASADQSVSPSPTRYDTYDWYLSFPTLGALADAVGAMQWPTWRRFVQHPAYDEVWQQRALVRHLKRATVPALTVGGWWDAEDMWGSLTTYATMESSDTNSHNHLVMGPWNHGVWAGHQDPKAEALGNLRFGSATGEYFRKQIQALWFAFWLKDKGDGRFPEATMFDAGANTWLTFDAWPPKQARVEKLYLHEDGRLSFDPPTAARGSDTYVSDPAHPVPYRVRPVERTYDPRGSHWDNWMAEDQRFVHNRPDVLCWETPPLAEDMTIAGNLSASLYASTTGSDADWVVKLIDVYPDTGLDRPTMGGYQLMVAGDILRGRYRTSFERAQRIPPGKVQMYTVDLHQQCYRFKKGHRIMVQVQSTWFPLYDRNPQVFVPNIFEAKATDYRAQTHRIYRTSRYPSHVEVMILP